MTAQPNPQDFSDLAPGWTGPKKLQFLDHLAGRGNVRAACARVGMSREAAYRLRRRDAVFARGWAAAMVLANDAAGEVLADRAIDGVEEEVWQRGEVVGTKRKYDTRLLLAHLARLDAAARNPKAQRDAGRFDELLAVIGGVAVPEELEHAVDVLPIDASGVIERADEVAEAAIAHQCSRDLSGDDYGDLACDDDDFYEKAVNEGLATRNAWVAGAWSFVDDALRQGADGSPRTVSDVSTAALAAGLAGAVGAGPAPQLRLP